jgi:glycerol-3-phosphate dehydrogenase (NAD(P)+)
LAKRLGIVGNGKIGSALGEALAADDWRVKYFDPRQEVSSVKSLAQLGEASDVIIIAAPSWTNRDIATELKPHAKDKLIVTVAKGVEPGFITMEDVLREVSGGHFDHGVLYGPMLASEIANKKPATILLASTSSKWADSFSGNSRLKIIYNDDPVSIALCGVLKNIFAISLGINDGLELGHNCKGALAVGILDEFQRLLTDLGGDPKQANSLAGLGDLLATGWSDLSFNHRMGKLLVKDPEAHPPKGEGVASLKEIESKVDLTNYRVLGATYRIVFESADPMSITGSS